MLEDLMGLLISIRVTDIVDIIIVAFLLYKLLEFIKDYLVPVVCTFR